MTNTGQMSAIQKKWNKERYKEDGICSSGRSAYKGKEDEADR